MIGHLPQRHICDRFCVCPEHQTQMWYNKRSDTHACVNPTCEYAHGYEDAVKNKLHDSRRSTR